MVNLVEYIVKALVDNPDAVSVTEVQGENGTEIHIKLDPKDVGLIIGKAGRTINAIRSLVKVKAIKDGVFVKVIVDDENRN